MKKERKGLTLIALVVTIIVLLIVVAIVITLTSGENGLFNKANTSNYHNALAELYDRSYAEISYLVIPDKVDGTDNFNFEDLYNSKGFTTFYEIKNGKIIDKSRNLELIGKEDFEKKIRERFEKEGKDCKYRNKGRSCKSKIRTNYYKRSDKHRYKCNGKCKTKC